MYSGGTQIGTKNVNVYNFRCLRPFFTFDSEIESFFIKNFESVEKPEIGVYGAEFHRLAFFFSRKYECVHLRFLNTSPF